MINLKEKICLRPWTHIEIHCDGKELYIYPCCPNWVKENYGKINNVDDFLNIQNEKANLFRKSILEGKYKYCKIDKCPYLINNSEDFIKNKNEVNINNLHIDSINLCYDRSCNLRCPSCRRNFEFITEKSNKILYNKIKLFQEQLLNFINNYKYPLSIEVEGSGDPFASELVFNMLQQIKYNSTLSFLFQTNGILFDELHWNKLKNIHKCKNNVLISIDAGDEESYKKTRIGGNWNILLKNLEYVYNIKNKGELNWVGLVFIVQYNNYKSIPQFIELCKKYNFEPVFLRLLNWGMYSDEVYKLYDVCNKENKYYNEFIKIVNELKSDFYYINWGNILLNN